MLKTHMESQAKKLVSLKNNKKKSLFFFYLKPNKFMEHFVFLLMVDNESVFGISR